MKEIQVSLFRLLALLALSIGLASNAFSAGDPVAGKEKAALCVACHAQDGNSISPQFPKIAGQVRGYVATQLAKFQSEQRAGAAMAGLVQSLTKQDMADLDAYYAQFESTPGSIQEEDVVAAMRGREIYRNGSKEYSIPACMACHGPSGAGIPTRYPRLAGQYKEYLVKSLGEFKSGEWQNDAMNTIAFRLTTQQINDLAIYLHGLN